MHKEDRRKLLYMKRDLLNRVQFFSHQRTPDENDDSAAAQHSVRGKLFEIELALGQLQRKNLRLANLRLL